MKKMMRYIGYTFRDCRRAFPGFFIMTYMLDAVGTAASILSPLLLAQILELAGEGRAADGSKLVGRIGLYGLCLVCTPVVEVLFRTGSKRARVLGERYFGSQLALFSSKIHLEALESPDILDRFHRASAAQNSQFNLFEMINMTLRSAVTCAGMIAVVGRYSPVLVFTGLFVLLPSVVTKIYFEKKMTSFRREQSNILRRCEYLRSLFADRQAVREMRVMGFEAYLTKKWGEANAEKVEGFCRINRDIHKKQTWGTILTNICFGFNIGVSFFLMAQGEISVGAFAACLSAFTAYDASVRTLVAMFFNAVQTYHVAEDYYDYFTIPTETEGVGVYRPFTDTIKARDVYFRYWGSNRDALCGLDCEIRKGEHVVIVGENGSGKTTFSRLLTGAYLPSRGNITYDGQQTRDMERRSLYAHISAVQQDFVHYHFSLRENVGISDCRRMEDGSAMEDLLARVAGEEFLERIGGLDVQIGREFGGLELSGGEWQRIAIARGLWKESDIIILDEPTSALDPLTEYEILSKFVEMIQDKTSIIISHRVGICRSADKIIVMKDGRMAECGRHEELLGKGGEYARIWREQAKWYV